MEINLFIGIFVFLFGLLFGSFFNVVIYRVPNNLSIIKPNSRCPTCNTTLKWNDLFPVFSYISLKGKCRYCNAKVSPRYAVVELLTAIITVLLFLKYSISVDFLVYLILIYILIPCFFIDLDHMIIPNGLVITGLVSFALIAGYKVIFTSEGILNNALGGLLGGGILLIVYFVGLLIYKKEALGFGDVKLFFVTGLFLGTKLTLLAFLFSIFTGAIAGIGIMLIGKKDGKTEMPFGPFIVFGTFLSIFIGEIVYNWYIGLFL